MAGISKRVSGAWVSGSERVMKTATDTITTLPADLYADGTNATVGLKGNMSQTGTPTQQNPIQPQECGERTRNLFDCNQTNDITDNVFINSGGTIVSNNGYYLSYPIPVEPDSVYTWRFDSDVHVAHTAPTVGFYDANHNFISAASHPGDVRYFSFTTPSNCKFVKASVYKTYKDEAMLNSGSTALPYEPNGYKIPISSANTTTPVYLGEVETTRQIKKLVLTGEENFTARTNTSHSFQLPITRSADNSLSVSSHYKMISSNQIDVVTGFYAIGSFVLIITDLQYSNVTDFKTYLQQQYANGTPVCVWYVLATPQTAVVNEPIRKIGDYADEVSSITIPTITGADTLSVGTTLQPSEVTVNYKGWHPVQSVHEKSRNLFDKGSQNWKVGYRIDDEGNEVSSQIAQYSQNRIEVSPSSNYTAFGFYPDGTSLSNSGFKLYCYDANDVWIENISASLNSPKEFTMPNNCHYIRIQVTTAYYSPNTAMINTGSTALPYEPYWK